MRSILLWVGILGGVIPTTAQTTPGNVFGDSIVVTASLTEESEDELPATVDVVESREIDSRQARTVLELLATLPSMAVVRSGSAGQVTSLFTRGTESNHTLAMWNGIVLNDPFFGGYNWAYQATEGVDRIEVVRGPFSSLYGGDALGGVVQILSGRRQGVDLDLEAGDHGYARIGLSGGASFGPVQIEVAGHLRQGDGQVENDFYDGEEVMLKADWELVEGLRLGLALRGLGAETGIAFSNGMPSPRRRIRWQERMVGLPLTYTRGAWTVDAQVTGVFYDYAFRDPDDLFGFTASDTTSQLLRGRTAVTRDLGAPGAWVAFGGEVDRSSVTDSSVFGQNLDDDGQSNWAVFTELYYPLGDFRFDVGLRHDGNDVYGGRTSPRLGLQWQMHPRTRIWASYGEAFAPPAVGELFYPVTGNPDLEPEIGTSFELGGELAIGSWSLGLTGYHNDLENLIDFDFVEFRNVNVGRARTRGVEAQAAYVRGRWAVRGNATYLDTEDLDTGRPLLRRPERSGNLVATYSPGKWSVSVTGFFVGDREDVDPITFERTVNEAYTRLDLAGRWQALGWLAPYLRLENLTDESYEEALGFPAPGITLVGGVRLSYR